MHFKIVFKNNALRRHILEQQRIKQHSSEYERIRNHLANSATPYKNQASLKSRADHLKSLGARAIDTIN